MGSELRGKLISIALEWQDRYGIPPQITSTISEYDAAMLVGFTEQKYSDHMQGLTAVNKGFDFIFNGIKYQIKGNRPSGKKGSRVTMVPKASNYDWDILIWILYDEKYNMQEAWSWNVIPYREAFHGKKRLSPNDYRKGKNLFKINSHSRSVND